MGSIAGQLADHVIVTTDNPRHEDPLAIIEDIVAGVAGKYEVVADRAAAIAHAIKLAGQEDSVLVAGKGSENYQLLGDQVVPFSDAEVAAAVLGVSA